MAFRQTVRALNHFNSIVIDKNVRLTRYLINTNNITDIEKKHLISEMEDSLDKYKKELEKSSFRLTKIYLGSNMFVSSILLGSNMLNIINFDFIEMLSMSTIITIAPLIVSCFVFPHKRFIEFDINKCNNILSYLKGHGAPIAY